MARVQPHHLDGVAELDIRRLAVLGDGNLVGTYSGGWLFTHPRVEGVHLLTMVDGVQPREHWDDLVGFGIGDLSVEGQGELEGLGAFASTGSAAGDANVAGDGCEQEDRPSTIFSVGMTLGPPALGDGAGIGCCDLTC